MSNPPFPKNNFLAILACVHAVSLAARSSIRGIQTDVHRVQHAEFSLCSGLSEGSNSKKKKKKEKSGMTAEACDPVALLNPTSPEQSPNMANGRVFFFICEPALWNSLPTANCPTLTLFVASSVN